MASSEAIRSGCSECGRYVLRAASPGEADACAGRSVCQAGATALTSENYGLRDRVRQTMGAARPFITDHRLVISHYGGTVLSAAIAPALSSDPKIENERSPQ